MMYWNSSPTPWPACVEASRSAIMMPVSAHTSDVVMNRPIFTRATGTPTLRAALASPPTPKIQLPDARAREDPGGERP